MNDDLFASNIKIQNKSFVNFFVFAKTSKQNRTIFVRKIFRNNKKTKKNVKKHLPKVQNRANLNTKISRPLNPVFRTRNPGLKGAIWLAESIFLPKQWAFSRIVMNFYICEWKRHTQIMLFVRKRQRLARFFQNPANQVTVFNITGYGRKHWV